MGRDPDPIGVVIDPVTGPPHISRRSVDPTARHVNGSGAGGRRRRASVDGRRRFGQILNLGLLFGRLAPEAACPLPAVPGLTPVTRHPDSIRRRYTPKTAHPDVIGPIFVPGPITGQPHHVVASRLLVRRQFIDWLRRLFGRQRTRRGLRFKRFRVPFMHRPAREHFNPLVFWGIGKHQRRRHHQIKSAEYGPRTLDHVGILAMKRLEAHAFFILPMIIRTKLARKRLYQACNDLLDRLTAIVKADGLGKTGRQSNRISRDRRLDDAVCLRCASRPGISKMSVVRGWNAYP